MKFLSRLSRNNGNGHKPTAEGAYGSPVAFTHESILASTYLFLPASIYEPLPKGSIRLLSLHPRCEPDDPIQCSLKIHQFDDSSLLSYVALSYVWGPTLPAFEIVVGGRNISVRKNLYDFLLQKTGNELLWIDALCIDQQNDQERNHQVERMGEIYKRADRVIAWLGLADNERLREALFRFGGTDGKTFNVPELPRVWYDNSPKAQTDLIDVCTNLQGLDELEYWSRSWVVQEFVVAKDLETRYGDIIFDIAELSAFNYDCKYYSPRSHVNPADLYEESPLPVLGSFSPALNMQSQRYSNFRNATPCPTLMELFQHNHVRKCQEPRDRVYSLLSLVDQKERDGIKVDYASDIREVACTVLANARIRNISIFAYAHSLTGMLRLSKKWEDHRRDSFVTNGRYLEVPCCIDGEVIGVKELRNDQIIHDKLHGVNLSRPDKFKAFVGELTELSESDSRKEFYQVNRSQRAPSNDNEELLHIMREVRTVQSSHLKSQLSEIRKLRPSILDNAIPVVQALESRQTREANSETADEPATDISSSNYALVVLRYKSFCYEYFDRSPLFVPVYVIGIGKGNISVGDLMMSFPWASATTTISVSPGPERLITGVVGLRERSTSDRHLSVNWLHSAWDQRVFPSVETDPGKSELGFYEQFTMKMTPEEILQFISKP